MLLLALTSVALLSSPISPLSAPDDGLEGATFNAAKYRVPGTGGGNMTLADLDLDGVPDVIVPNPLSGGGAISVLYGLGDGTYEESVVPLAWGRASFVLAVDVQSDGLPDLVMLSAAGAEVLVFENGGNRVFNLGQSVPLTTSFPSSIAFGLVAGDIDEDGDVDLIASTDVTQVLLGDGAGGFTAAGQIPPSPGAGTVVVVELVDLVGSTDLDLVTRQGPSLGVYAGAAGAAFDPALVTLLPFDDYVGLADLNADGELDLVTSEALGDRISVSTGVGDGTFHSPTQYTVGPRPWRVEVADFNADGLPDVVVSLESTLSLLGGRLVVRLGQSGGGLGPAVTYKFGSSPRDVVVQDVDRDGVLDLLVMHVLGRDVGVLRGRGDGTFNAPPEVSVGATPAETFVEDFDGDGIADLVAASGDNLGFRRGLGSGADFGPLVESFSDIGARTALSGDVDGDGLLDVVVSGSRFFNAFKTVVMLGDGTGAFVVSDELIEEPTTRTQWDLGDFDGDGLLDLAIVNQSDLRIRMGLGAGTFGQPITIATPGYSPTAVAAGDLDGDGDTDVVISSSVGPAAGSGATAVWANDGSGTFTFGGTLLIDRTRGVWVADMNGDGWLDVVSYINGGPLAPSLAVSFGSGSLTFAPAVVNSLDQSPVDLELADVNVDGLLDYVTSHLGVYGDVQLRLGLAGGLIGPGEVYSVGGEAIGVGVGDLDGDSNPDVAVCATTAGAVTIYRNRAAVRLDEYCDALPSSTGQAVRLTGAGSRSIVANDFRVTVEGLPTSSTAILFSGPEPGARPMPSGLLCVRGALRRETGVVPTGTSGLVQIPLDVPGLSVLPGMTRYFQGWFSDLGAGSGSFGFSNGLAVLFCP